MPKYHVDVEVTKIYKKQYELTIYADSEDDADNKARERAENWGGNADDVEVEVLNISED